MSNSITQRWITSEEAAQYAGVHPESMRCWFRAGDIKSIRVGQTYRTKAEFIDDFLLGGIS